MPSVETDNDNGVIIMDLTPGLEILENREGTGAAAAAGDTVKYDCRIFLNRGDEVPMGQSTSETILGKRRVIAGVEKSLIGMRAGGFRQVRVSPHLAYGDAGATDSIPPNAVLVISLWLRGIIPPCRLSSDTMINSD